MAMPADSQSQNPAPLRCCVLTPQGRGAIATIAVRGAGAIAAVARRFFPIKGKDLAEIHLGRVVFGRFETSATTAEELVVGLIAADEVEIHCHGGKAAVEAIREVLVAEGCQPIAPASWVHEQESDLLAAQAILSVASARTERAAAILLDQYRGALRKALDNLDQALVRGDISAADAAIDELLARADLGLHLTKPWKIVIAGRPNAGKSSLMNAILGYQRSIVWPEPGTTRDVLTATTAIDGWPVEMTDTAGLRAAADSLEAEGVARAKVQVATADLTIFVAEMTALWDDPLYQQIKSESRRPPVIVHNKCDLARSTSDQRPAGIEASALTGQGVDRLCRAIVQALVPAPPPRGSAIPFTAEQVAALTAAAREVKNGDASAARQQMKTLDVQ